ncbi:MAG: NADH-ubiquinone oxidoreductase-F iron-sulfur binding region domain-containing protein [Verrucomicrobiota bacterium]|nr:NADH-ubiquinone oxidoreductase-F iron-sulfur binding region domain-containing protein [Verrucomicrobiota bacterium]
MIKTIRVGMGSCGIAAGADEVLEKLREKTSIKIEAVGCIGFCYAEPLVEIITKDSSVFYRNVKPTNKNILDILDLSEEGRLNIPKKRLEKGLTKVLHLAGRVDPLSIEEYMQNNGFEALRKTSALSPEDVVEEVKISGLRGRGGGGFPTGLKWSFLANKKADTKVLICNADEGDPGAFMDRSLMESVPYQILEGMLIAAYATGAHKLFIYCRAEYPLAIKHLKYAIKKIETHELNVIHGKKISIIIKEGAGAFVCGEETALIASLEGKRGTPRFRPPFPTDSGWNQFPTLINNVETFANIPMIINEGGENYAKIGTEKSKGTKLFALAGDLKYPGLIEVPMGTTLAEIVFDVGGAKKEEVKAVQIGGPSGGCIPVELFDTPIDYDSLTSLGAIMGSGGLIVIGSNRCMVETARYFLDFTHRESCGKCTFCRIGTKRMFETLERITEGNGKVEDLTFLREMGDKVKKASLCGLGQTAPNPVLATLRYFIDEYNEHVYNSNCPTLECSALVDVEIDKNGCIECGLCIKNCAVNAISDDFVIDNNICTRCNSCIEVCPKNVISRTHKGEGYYSE